MRTHNTSITQRCQPGMPLALLLFLWLCSSYCFADIHKTSGVPIVLNVKKSDKGLCISKPLLFQRALDIEPGSAFTFNMDKWKELAKCGLFANLTAQSSIAPDGGVALRISGTELPSTYFTPEASIVASLESPEVLGGITWKNINFRGLGEQLHASIFKKEGLEEGTLNLDPTVSVKWVDNSIGKSSRISVSHSAENVLESCREVLTLAAQRAVAVLGGPELLFQRNSVRSTTSSIKLQETVTIRSGILGKFLKSITYGVEPFKRTMMMSTIQDGGNDLKCTTTGGKSTLRADVKGISISGWHEGGTTQTTPPISSPGRASGERFHLLGLSAALPTLRREVRVDHLLPKVPQLRGRVLTLLQSTKLKTVKSWGAGCVPAHHHSDASGSGDLLVRGLCDTGTRIASGASIKADLYVDGLLPASALLGVFCDVGVLRAAESPLGAEGSDALRVVGETAVDKACSVGVSVRVLGLRADYGYRLGQTKRSPQLHLGFDRGD